MEGPLMADPTFVGVVPHPEWVNEDDAEKALVSSNRRLVLSRMIGLNK